MPRIQSYLALSKKSFRRMEVTNLETTTQDRPSVCNKPPLCFTTTCTYSTVSSRSRHQKPNQRSTSVPVSQIWQDEPSKDRALPRRSWTSVECQRSYKLRSSSQPSNPKKAKKQPTHTASTSSRRPNRKKSIPRARLTHSSQLMQGR